MKIKHVLIAFIGIAILASCKKKEEETPTPDSVGTFSTVVQMR